MPANTHVRLSPVEPSWVWPWQLASLGMWLYALFFALIGVSGRRVGPVDPVLWLGPVALLFFMGLGLRMRSKLVTLLYIAGTSVAVLWMAIAYLLSPLPAMLMGLPVAALLYVPSAGMIIHWPRLRW